MKRPSVRSIHHLITLTFVTAFIVASSSARAEDGKVYPATMCQGSLVGNPPIISYTGKSVRNNSTVNSAVVSCPIVKDIIFSVTGANEAYLRYCKGSAGLNSSLYSYSAFGTSSYLNSKWDFGSAGCNKTISHNPIASYSQGYYTLIVTMPPSNAGSGTKTELFSYRLDEN
jgi:hypothetical protein